MENKKYPKTNLTISNIISKYQDKMFEEFDNLDISSNRVVDILMDQGEYELLDAYENWLEDGEL